MDLLEEKVPVFHGQNGPLPQDNSESEAVKFIIEEANRQDEMPLYVLCIGAITNVAKALELRPEIALKMTIVWIGCNPIDGHTTYRENFCFEFNSCNDIDAANVVLQSNGTVWVIPNIVYGSMHISFAEIQKKIASCGAIGEFLYKNLIGFYEGKNSAWSASESWSLGDSPAVGVVLEPNCGGKMQVPAPFIESDNSYTYKENAPLIWVYTSINSRFIIEDLICKLQILYGQESEQCK